MPREFLFGPAAVGRHMQQAGGSAVVLHCWWSGQITGRCRTGSLASKDARVA
jgi:hypothetical protein